MRSRVLKLLLAGAAGAATGLTAVMLPRRRRLTPEQHERRRRLEVNARGRTGNAIVLDVQNGMLSYSYEVGGVEYIASQDLTAFSELLPADPSSLSGRPAIIKYLADNPANSIVACEGWNGLLFQPVSPEAP